MFSLTLFRFTSFAGLRGASHKLGRAVALASGLGSFAFKNYSLGDVASICKVSYRGFMKIFEGIISDRGSKYAVSGGACTSSSEAKAFIKELCRKKKFAKATHNTWAFLKDGVMVKNDDGESGGGMIIAKILGRAGLSNHIVVVTRWYGGKHLGGDRFRHVQNAVKYYLEHF